MQLLRSVRVRLSHFLRAVKPPQIIVFVFLALILVGAFVLTLPVSSAAGQSTPFLTCLFTATSATCVTGLVLVDTGLYWSSFGKVVIILLIQIGGLGFLTIVSVFYMMLKRRFGLRQRMVLAQSLSLDSMNDIPSVIRRIFLGTAVIEGSGALILTLRFLPEFGFPKALGYGVFHAISAFCNAGFDIFGDAALGGSIIRYQTDPVVCLTFMALITLGGLGFLVWSELISGKKWSKLSVYTRLVLILTAFLLVFGGGLFALIEWNNPQTIGGLSAGEKLLVSAFQSVTTRTAGFASFPQENMTEASMAVCDLLMLIGGSSGSTAGGLKTVTLFVVLLGAWSSVRGKSRVSILRRTIPHEAVMQAVMLFVLMFGLCFSGGVVISALNGCSFSKAIFETVSALATVGLTAGLTGSLNAVSKVIIIVFMFFGRVGIMTISVGFLTAKREAERFAYADTKVLIG